MAKVPVIGMYDDDYTHLVGTEMDSDEFDAIFDKTPMELNVERPAMLFFLTRYACTAVEKEWDRIVCKVLSETYGEKTWLEATSGLVYARPMQRTVMCPREGMENRDFYILCRTFIKFLSVFIRRLHFLGEENLPEGARYYSEGFTSVKDAKLFLRHTIRSLMDFRCRMMHSMAAISSREALAFVLTIRKVRQILLPLRPPIVPAATRLDKMKEEVDPGVFLDEAVGWLKDMCIDDVEPFVIDVHRKSIYQVMRLFGFIILTMLNRYLEEPVKFIVGEEEAVSQVKDFGNKCPWPYILVYRDFVREHVKERKDFLDMRRGEPEGEEQTPRGRLRQRLKRYKKPKDPTRDIVDECAPQMNSAVTVLGGAFSLRTLVNYSREEDLKPTRIRNCTKACHYLASNLTGDKELFAEMKRKIERVEPEETFEVEERKREVKFWPQEYPILVGCARDETSREDDRHLWLSPSMNAGPLVGRAGILKEILQSISDSLGRLSPARVLLAGEPGIGKTSLAISTAFRLRKKCAEHYWLTATNRNMLLRSLSELGAFLRAENRRFEEVKDDVRVAKLRLDSTERPIMLLIDDLQDIRLLDEFVPREHHVIITSSDENVIEQAGKMAVDVFKLRPLTTEEGLRLLKTRCRCARDEGTKQMLFGNPDLSEWLENDLRLIPRSVENAAFILLDHDLTEAKKQFEICSGLGNRFDDYEAESIKP